MKLQSNQSSIVISNERVDDLPLLLGFMIQIGLREILDSHIPAHWKQRKLSWGWTAVIWLAYILTEGDHRKVSVEEFIKRAKITIESVTKQEVDELDFTTDRLAHLLNYLSNRSYWEPIERELNERTIKVYELPTDLARCDATTISGYHEEDETSLFQFGHSKDNPNLRQIKMMVGALDPLGLPLAVDVVSGERADDGLYIPLIDRIHQNLRKKGLLYCGDCKISSFETRLYIKSLGNHYLSPLPMTGRSSENMQAWIQEGIDKDNKGELQQVFRENEKGEAILIAKGYETERELSGILGDEEIKWKERVLIVHSPSYAAQQEKGLEKRLENAQKKLESLTPIPGRGKRQITDEATLKYKIEQILKTHRVENFFTIEYHKEVEKEIKYISRGRGSKDRPQKVIKKIRYQIDQIICQDKKIEEHKKTLGWKAFITDVEKEKLDLEKSVLCYRKEYRVERIFNRLKSRLNVAPLFVRRNDQIKGITHLLTLGVRVLTIIEYVMHRSLKKDNAVLPGLYREAKKKVTSTPTAERILHTFSNIILTTISDGNQMVRYINPLSALQLEMLKRLKLGQDIYCCLEIKDSEILLTN